MYRIIIRSETIIPQIIKFLKNTFFFKFNFKKPGRIRTNINIKAIDGIISSNPIFNFSKNLLLFEKIS